MRIKTPVHRILFISALVAIGSLTRAEVTNAAADFDERPVPVKSVAPDYPSEMKDAHASGIVTLSVLVDENGDVRDQRVAKSTRPEFESAALTAVEKWKFKPAKKAGVAVKAKITIPIKFTYES